MENTGFINIYGNTVRTSDISLITNVSEVWDEKTKGKREFTNYEFSIIFNSRHELIVKHTDIKEIKRQAEKIKKAVTSNDIFFSMSKTKTKP